MTNVIGDIAGNFKTLMALIKKMPSGEVISVGDMVDRGPRGKEVLEWFRNNGRAIMGNHEHLMLDHFDDTGYYEMGIWFFNGGGATYRSFNYAPPDKELLNWVKSLPLYLEIDNCLISHSFVDQDLGLEKSCELGSTIRDNPHSIIWNRWEPKRFPGYRLQIAGHNSQFRYKRFSDEEGEFAICLDSSRDEVLTGIHLETGKIYQQKYID